MNNARIENVIADVNIYEILDSLDVGIWLIEYSASKQIYRMYGDRSMMRILGIEDVEATTPEECYRYWFSRIDEHYLKDVQYVIGRMIELFHKHPDGSTIDEVNYIWHKDGVGDVSIRCGGRIIGYADGVYRICGYHQDFTEIVKMRDGIKDDNISRLKREIGDIKYLKEYYEELAYIDELTGLVNRRGFTDRARYIVSHQMRRSGDVLWIAMLDLDYFKQINDTYGHLNGDTVLRFVSRVLLGLSIEDEHVYVFRYGGEEFIIMIYQHTAEEVRRILESCLKEIREGIIEINGNQTVQITCSIGAAGLHNHDSARNTDELIRFAVQKADLLLYRAKKEGRDRLCMDEL